MLQCLNSSILAGFCKLNDCWSLFKENSIFFKSSIENLKLLHIPSISIDYFSRAARDIAAGRAWRRDETNGCQFGTATEDVPLRTSVWASRRRGAQQSHGYFCQAHGELLAHTTRHESTRIFTAIVTAEAAVKLTLSLLRWHVSHLAEVNETINLAVTVRTRVTPSFKVRVCFRAILLCLILKRVLVAY